MCVFRSSTNFSVTFYLQHRNVAESGLKFLKKKQKKSSFPKNFQNFKIKQSISELELVQCLHMFQPKPRALRSGKWRVAPEVYNGTIYPASCTGPAMMMSNRAVKILSDEAKVTNDDFPIDDIYISGILREKTGLDIRKPPGGAEHFAKVILSSQLTQNETIADRIL